MNLGCGRCVWLQPCSSGSVASREAQSPRGGTTVETRIHPFRRIIHQVPPYRELKLRADRGSNTRLHRTRSAADKEYHQRVSRQEAVSTLRAQQAVLHARFGVTHLDLFGSVARDEVGQGSDVDLLVEFDQLVGLFRFMELQSYLEDLLRCGVDLGTPQSLKPRIHDRVLAEAVRVV
jgi:predicted nucleotidyltransferase